MEIVEDKGFDISWLTAFRDTDAFDIISILLGIIVVVSFLIYLKKATDEQKRKPYKIVVLGITAFYVVWLGIGIAFK